MRSGLRRFPKKTKLFLAEFAGRPHPGGNRAGIMEMTLPDKPNGESLAMRIASSSPS